MADGFFICYNFHMCLAVPNKIIKIKGEWAVVDSGEHTHRANLSLVKNAKVGDYVIVHEDMVLNKIPGQEAKKILRMINEKK